MSYALYEIGGLRFWRQREINLRNSIKAELVETVTETLLNINQMWRFEEVEAPLMMPMSRMNKEYTNKDVFVLQDAPGGEEDWGLRAETTEGTYAIASQLMRESNMKPPLGFYQMGQSFRRETTDGATAAKLRFNAFYQLEFQLIFAADTKADLHTDLRTALVAKVACITGRPARLVQSDRLPSYATETVDIEVLLANGEWREVASTSRRTDFPKVAGFNKPVLCFEIAFGMDRMVAITQGESDG